MQNPKTVLFVVFFVLGGTWAGTLAPTASHHVLGWPEVRLSAGQNATAGQFPWHVSLIMDSKRFCSGALVAPNWVLTSANCTSRYSKFLVSLGSLYPDSHFVEQTISHEKFVHPDYDAVADANDVGLIKLTRNINFTETISAVGIEGSTESFAGCNATIAGWGEPSSKMMDNLSPTLHWTELAVLDNRKCSDDLGMTIDDSHMCTSGANSSGICEGDDGSPLVLNLNGVWRLVGVATSSSTSGCGTGTASMYTRVSQHADWIANITGINVIVSPSSGTSVKGRFWMVGCMLGMGLWWSTKRYVTEM